MIDLRMGDCLDVMRDIQDQSVDMVLCDLPYGTTQNKWDVVIPLDALWQQYWRVCRGSVVLTAAQPFTSILTCSSLQFFRYGWVWEKPNGSNQTMAKAQPLRVQEDVLVFSKKSAHNHSADRMLYNPQGLVVYGKKTRQGTKISENLGADRLREKEYIQEFTNYPRSVIKFGQDTPKVHPTQKPVALMEYMIRTYTDPGMIVLDNCMGSGTTGVACVSTGRSFIGIEKDERYFDVARARIEAAQAAAVREAVAVE